MQTDYENYFSSAADANDVWQRLHLSLEPFGVSHILYAVGHLADVITEEHLDRVLGCASITHTFHLKTSYPSDLSNTATGDYRLDQDLSALHSIVNTSPFIWSEHNSLQANTLRKNLATEQPFWFDIKSEGVTIPLRFGSFGKGGVGLSMARLSKQQFQQVWRQSEHDIINIVSVFDRVVRAPFWSW